MSYEVISKAIEKGARQGNPLTGTATTTEAIVKIFNKQSRAIALYNRSEDEPLLYSIDGGTTYLSVGPLASTERPYECKDFRVKTAANTAVYDFEYAEAQ